MKDLAAEYRIVKKVNTIELQTELNRLGAEGYRVCTHTTTRTEGVLIHVVIMEK